MFIIETWSSLSINIRSITHLRATPVPRQPQAMQITIKTLTGRKQTFNFEGENTILHVKEALQEKEGIQVNQIRLIYSGRQLSDDKTLQDYNVLAGGTIHMVLQLRGGQKLPQSTT